MRKMAKYKWKNYKTDETTLSEFKLKAA